MNWMDTSPWHLILDTIEVNAPTIFNNLLLVGLAGFAWWSDRARKREANEAKIERKETHKKIDVVEKKTEAVHNLVNHPLGLALRSLADLYDEKARRTENPIDISLAISSRKASVEHDKNQVIADKVREDEAELQRIEIAEFLKKKP